MNDEQFLVAQIGRTIGLHGDLKLNLHTDFPEQFKSGTSFDSKHGKLQIASYNPTRSLVSFIGYASIDDAKKLTNTKLYSTLEQTREQCELDNGQYFWFDILGSSVYDGDELLGTVTEIERMLNTDYFIIETDKVLVENGSVKSFLLPYIPRYVSDIDLDSKRVITKDAKEILEAS